MILAGRIDNGSEEVDASADAEADTSVGTGPAPVLGIAAEPVVALVDTSAAPAPVVISLENVSSVFCDSLSLSSQYAAADLLNPFRILRKSRELRPREFYALRDINLEVRRNETLGVIGTYRSGKTTLANLIGGLFRPTFGKVTVTGKSLLINSIGSGFRPMLDLWENVLFRAVLLGAPRQGLEDRCRKILEFAELTGREKTQLFNLDPIAVKRLGMSTVLHVDADILVFDGMLGAGDMEFKEKSFALTCERIRDRTTVIVTHDTDILSQLADRVLVLDQGTIVALGPPEEALAVFEYGLENGGRRFLPVSSSEEGDSDDGEDDDVDSGFEGEAELDASSIVGADGESVPNETASGVGPIRIVKIKPLRQREVRGEVVSVSVAERPPFTKEYDPLFWPGDNVQLQLVYEANYGFVFDEIRIGIHQPGALIPLAGRTIAVRKLFPGIEEMRIETGQQITISCSLVIPNLYRSHYGLALGVAPKGQRICKKDISKILIFELRTDSEPGSGLRLEIPQINISAVSEAPRRAGDQAPLPKDGEDTSSSSAAACGVVHGKELCHVERGLSRRAENG